LATKYFLNIQKIYKVMEDVKQPSSSSTGASNPVNQPVPLDNSKAAVGVWLVKVNYLH